MITIIPIPKLRRLCGMQSHDDLHTAIIFTPDGLLEPPLRAIGEIRDTDPLIVTIALLDTRNDLLEQQLLQHGCDDVMIAPICADTMAERLLLRIRQRGWSIGSNEVVQFYETKVDFGELQVYRNGRVRPISRGLADLLQYFLANANHVVSRVQITETLWADHVIDPEGKNLDMHVAKLRRLLEPPDLHGVSMIQTVRGVGYRFVMPSDGKQLNQSVQTLTKSSQQFLETHAPTLLSAPAVSDTHKEFDN